MAFAVYCFDNTEIIFLFFISFFVVVAKPLIYFLNYIWIDALDCYSIFTLPGPKLSERTISSYTRFLSIIDRQYITWI